MNSALLQAGVFSASVFLSSAALATADRSVKAVEQSPSTQINDLCHKIGSKLSSVSEKECRDIDFQAPRFFSVNGLPIVEKHFKATEEDAPRILFIGGIHGDEYSSVSVTFKWLTTLSEHHSGSYDWLFVPLSNPDGLLKRKSTRVNANDVDLNRNFIPADGFADPLAHWQERAKRRARYYPGKAPLSEPETQVIHQLIEEYKPTVIVSVHAPHGILDFDGNSIQPPSRLGPLYLKQLGTYPGSLGNYAWFVKKIPVMTIELKHAGIMPKPHEVTKMWVDLVRWVDKKTKREVDYAQGESVLKEGTAPTQ